MRKILLWALAVVCVVAAAAVTTDAHIPRLPQLRPAVGLGQGAAMYDW
jgi:hypothetical protein